jgi:hypothetical protein
MTFLDKSLENMMNEIEFTKWIYFDYHAPEKYWSVVDGTYLTRWAKEILEIVPSQIYEKENKDDETEMFIALALENSLLRGHKNDLSQPISVKVFEGEKGYVVRIRDGGKGFPFKQYIKEKNQHIEGNGQGLSTGRIIEHEVSYEGDGSIVNIMIKK